MMFFGKKRRRMIFFVIVFFILQTTLYGQDDKTPFVPISSVFHDFGWNMLNSITYNYGMNFAAAAAETYLFIETGMDWKWRNISYNNLRLAKLGAPSLFIGYVVPAIVPIVAYTSGRSLKNEKLQITGLALAQSVLVTLAIQSPLKMISGRAMPGIINTLDHTRRSELDDFSGEFDWFNMNPIRGWPSGHTACAFAAAAVVAEMYPSNFFLKVAAYSYATFIGLGVTLNVHWLSEAVAGALIGYAVGKTVGRSFNGLLNDDIQKKAVTFYVTPAFAGVRMRL
ncbi:MAG: phosphatase PAP2 family protein [Spirochaetaceae bacterium]|jgi:membrane-associated phospholipid phosphatase|nr:phosphatase PAP2 family protein [Spirochaetaceae bacterium]